MSRPSDCRFDAAPTERAGALKIVSGICKLYIGWARAPGYELSDLEQDCLMRFICTTCRVTAKCRDDSMEGAVRSQRSGEGGRNSCGDDEVFARRIVAHVRYTVMNRRRRESIRRHQALPEDVASTKHDDPNEAELEEAAARLVRPLGTAQQKLLLSVLSRRSRTAELLSAIDELNALGDRLPGKFHGVFRMAMEGHTYSEIADELGLGVEGVGYRLKHARDLICRMLEELES